MWTQSSGRASWTTASCVRRLTADDAPAFAQGFKDDPTLGVMVGTDTDPTVDEVALQTADENGPEGIPALAIADATTRARSSAGSGCTA